MPEDGGGEGSRGIVLRELGRMKVVLLVILLILGWGVVTPLPSEPHKKEATEQAGLGHAIHITSDAVESDHRMKWLEFTGNVKATQEDAIITADRVKVFYKSGKDVSGETNTVEKIVSRGHVKIVFDDKTKTAVADKAVYTADPRVLVLSGREATVQSGSNIIRGEKITLFLAENRTVVEGDGKRQVDATFFVEGEQGLAQ